MRALTLLLSLSLWLVYSCNKPVEVVKGSHFTSLDPKQIGIDFENNLTYTEAFNVYLYRSFYNGAGVGMGDFNNDGWLDLYFCGNQADNKLYLNEGPGNDENGAFQFRDVTEAAGVSSHLSWSTGVSVVDINGDGWLDLYVCKSGKPDGENRHNELFINNGDPDEAGVPTFTESAAAYGIHDLGFSVQAAFFDYDKDGDLDMYLSNNSINPTDVILDAKKGLRDKADPAGGNKLYRNDAIGKLNAHSRPNQPVFTDVSQDAGIYSSTIGFGLGVSIGDVNRDGWPDIYVANDFFEKDYLYLNQGKNRTPAFKESLEATMNEISMGAMGVDIADLNNDAFPEIFVTEMLPDGDARRKTKAQFDNWDTYRLKVKNGYYRQFPRNTLQLNNGPNASAGNLSFSEISRFAGVDATDWSWGVLVADLDNDGFKDIFVANGIYKDLLDQDFIDFYADQDRLRKIYQETGGVIKQMIDDIPSVPLPNYLYTQTGDLNFKNVSEAWGLGTPGFSNGCAYGDLDNDGDLDLVVNNINMPPFIYRNETSQKTDNHFLNLSLVGSSRNNFAIGAQVTLKAQGKTFFQEQTPVRGTLSSVDPRLNFGLGNITRIDTLEVNWPEGGQIRLFNVATDQFLTIRKEENQMIPVKTEKVEKKNQLLRDVTNEVQAHYQHQENDFVDFDRDKLAFNMVSTEGPKMATGDLNNDGLPDFYVGGAKDTPGSLFIAQANGTFVQTNQEIFEKDQVSEDLDAVFFDADSDGDQDLLVASGGYEFPRSSFALADRLYLNDGQGNFTRSEQIIPNNKLESTSSLAVADVDQDGDLDLFLGVRLQPMQYGVPASSYLLLNDGKGNFTDATAQHAPGLKNIGMVTDALWMDFDGDHDEDLIVVGDWMPVKIFQNQDGKLTDVSEQSGLVQTDGLWHVLEKADLDGDGDEDLIAGNMGLNAQFKASAEKPVTLYINDFDQNGKLDHVITLYEGDRAYPVAMKKDMTRQMPYLSKKYLKHAAYKEQTIDSIFSPKQLSTALALRAFQMETVVFWNEGGKFTRQILPMEAQFSPIHSILVDDVDQDGKPDILLGGNLFRAKPQTGIYGGTYGVVLKSLGQRKFKTLQHDDSGFFVKGEIRDLQQLDLNNQHLVLVSTNNDSLKVFERSLILNRNQ